jgi:hypothetical protein
MHLSPLKSQNRLARGHERFCVTAIGTFPEPAIFSIFDGFEEIFTDDVGLVGCFLRAVFLADDFFKFGIIPAFHAFFFHLLPCICVHVLLGNLSFNSKIVGELAFVASFTFSLFKVDASKVSSGECHVEGTERFLDLCRMELFEAPVQA